MDATLSDPRLGSLLEERYRITGRIAQGGMASVYEAVDLRLDRSVAVKIMHEPYANDPVFVERFIREAKSAARLSHPNIVAVYDQGKDGDTTYLVMEKVDGYTLREVLAERGRLSAAEAVGVIEPILQALSIAHDSGLIHRDVKPENVLISTNSLVKVADFGLARAVEAAKASTTRSVAMGTVAYASPEQIMEGQADPSSDVYAAGIVLYEAVTGHVPFAGTSPVNIAFQHVHHDVPAPQELAPDLPDALNELIVRATRRDRQSRPADAGMFLMELRGICNELGLHPVGLTVSLANTMKVPVLTSNTVVSPPPNNATNMEALPSAAAAEATTIITPDLRGKIRHLRSRSRNKSERVKAAWYIGGATVIVLALIAAIWIWAVSGTDYVSAPKLVGLTKTAAVEKAEKAGLTIKYGQARNSDTVPAGTVLTQQPDAQGKVAEHGSVTLVLSSGPQRVKVPQVEGLPEEQAKTLLEASKFNITIEREHHATIPLDMGTRTDPIAGKSIPRGSNIKLFLSDGPEFVLVPQVVALTQAKAEQDITAAGLTASVVEQPEPTKPPGTVLAQSHPAGAQLRPGDTVTITVARAIRPDDPGASVIVPDVTGMSYEEAKEVLESHNLRAEREGRRQGKVVAQSPSPDSQAKPGDKIRVFVY